MYDMLTDFIEKIMNNQEIVSKWRDNFRNKFRRYND